MKKVVRTNKGIIPTVQAAPAGTVHTVSTAKYVPRPSGPPTPVWSRYVDSRLKQFCLR